MTGRLLVSPLGICVHVGGRRFATECGPLLMQRVRASRGGCANVPDGELSFELVERVSKAGSTATMASRSQVK